jgi:hypothetical protein
MGETIGLALTIDCIIVALPWITGLGWESVRVCILYVVLSYYGSMEEEGVGSTKFGQSQSTIAGIPRLLN